MYLNEPSFSSVNLQKSDYTFTTGTAHSLFQNGCEEEFWI